MSRTLKDTKEMVFARRTWNVKGAKSEAIINQSMTLALEELSQRLSTALDAQAWNTVIYKTISSEDEGIEINATLDPVVLKITRTGGLPLLAWLPKTDGTWNAVMWLEITTTRTIDGTSTTVYETRQTLDWWSALQNSGTHYFVSIDRPWPNTTDTALAFKIYQRLIWLPSECHGLTQPNATFLRDETSHFACEVITHQMDNVALLHPDLQTSSIPTQLAHDMPHTEPAPMSAPVCTPAAIGLNVPVPWVGPWQEGDFEFYYTVCWGKTDPQWQQARNGFNDIIFESAPSPVSAVYKHSTSPGQAIKISVMNPDQMRGFFDSSKLSYGHSGRFIRLYVARTGLRTTGLGTMNQVESDKVAYLLTQFNATTATSNFVWDGSVLPEFTRRMRTRAGHYIGYRIYPTADKRYEVTMRLRYIPPALMSEGDIMPINPLAYSVFLEFCEANVALVDGSDVNSYERIMGRALAKVPTLKSQLRGIQSVPGVAYTVPIRPALSTWPNVQTVPGSLLDI